MNTKIYFFFPYLIESGVPLLFVRLANELGKNKIESHVVDYIDGVMSKNIVYDKYVRLIPFKDGEKCIIPEDSILVMQSILPYTIRPELIISTNTKLFFWNLYSYNLVPTFFPLPLIKNLERNFFIIYFLLSKIFVRRLKLLNEFVKLSIENKGLMFMDDENLRNTNKYLFSNFKIKEYLPLPIEGINKIKIKENINNNLQICWIGRLCDFKINILVYTINKLNVFSEKFKFNIIYTIIGDGPFMNKLKSIKFKNDYFKLKLLGGVSTNKLANLLLSEVHLVTAMGTSALESGKLGIPTILLDYSYSKIPFNYKFRWLFESKNFELGHEITINDLDEKGDSLFKMLNYAKSNYEKISEKTFNYVLKNHNMKSFISIFLNKLNDSDLRFSDINPLILRKSLSRKFYDKFRGYC